MPAPQLNGNRQPAGPQPQENDWRRPQKSQVDQLVDGHQLTQLPIQCGSAHVDAEQLHGYHLCKRHVSKMWSNYKSGKVKALADTVNKNSQILTSRAESPFESGFAAHKALHQIVKLRPQHLLALARQQTNGLAQAVAK